MVRVLHVFDHSLPLHSGYSFRSRALMLASRRHGIETHHLTTPRHTRSGPDPEEADGLIFHRTPAPPQRPPGLREMVEMDATTKRLDRLVGDLRPDILHAHSPVLTAWPAIFAGRKHGVPVVYEIRAFWEDAAVGNGQGREGSPRYRATRWLETRACRRVAAVGAICEGLLRDLASRGIDPAKMFSAPNGVSLDEFGEPLPQDTGLAAELGFEPGDELMGFIGSFYDYEGLDDLIAAMSAIAAARPRARLLLVGGGPVEAALRAQAVASPAAARIHFVGRVPQARVDRYYSLIDVLVYPRKRMRLTELVTPLKPLEAMAQEKLVAASDVGGHRELVEDGLTGTLFPPDDPARLATALVALFADRGGWPARRAAGKRFVTEQRNWDASAANYLPVYRRLARRAVANPPLAAH